MLKIVHCVIAPILFVLQTTTISLAQNENQNLALGKQATQSGIYYGRDASRAVDGYLYSQPGDSVHCSGIDTSDRSYQGNRDFAWWQVDLADIYTVQSVTVFNTDNEIEWQFLYNFTVYVSYQSDISDAASRSVCQWVKPVLVVIDGAPGVFRVLRNDSYTVNCTIPLVGQYVTIQRVGGSNPGRMTLCEVEVDGTKYYQCQNCMGNCNHNTGCESCNPGYYPPTCTRGCDRGTFGINCANQCPQCPDKSSTCERVTGQCPCPNGLYCKPSTVAIESNTTSPEVYDIYGNDFTTENSIPENSTFIGSVSGAEQLRGTRATVFGALGLVIVLQILKLRDS